MALLASAAMLGGSPALAQEMHGDCHGAMMGKRPAVIAVSGTGEATVAPDMATITLGVSTRADTASEAMSLNNSQQSAVLQALGDAGIEPRDIQTSSLRLNPQMDYSSDGQPPQLNGYSAQNMVTVRVRDMDNLGNVLDAIVSAGANEIRSISLGRDDSAAVLDEARRSAVEQARHKAEVMAEAAGQQLGRVLVISDVASSGDQPRPMMADGMMAMEAKSVPVAQGELTVTADVQMKFALLGADGAAADCAGGHNAHHGDADLDEPMPLPDEEGADEAPAN